MEHSRNERNKKPPIRQKNHQKILLKSPKEKIIQFSDKKIGENNIKFLISQIEISNDNDNFFYSFIESCVRDDFYHHC